MNYLRMPNFYVVKPVKCQVSWLSCQGDWTAESSGQLVKLTRTQALTSRIWPQDSSTLCISPLAALKLRAKLTGYPKLSGSNMGPVIEKKDRLDFFWQLFLKELYYKCTKVIGHGKINPRSWEVRPHLTGISPTSGQLWLHHDSCESPSQFPICGPRSTKD